MRKNPCYTTNSFVNFNVKNNVFVIFVNKLTFLSYKNSKKLVKSRLLCKMLYNVFTISTYQN
ncbi:hypothetical protein [Enterococcus faecalis]|uniref:hypothetical protein n=1 Tax=Enterococcus faecalis TaxID=1351 RepID=UPI0028C4923E|nr:hypothetical protein [Enterococcus faecalis]